MSDLPIQTPIDYTSRDYASIRKAMLDRIPDLVPEWTSRSSSDFGVALVELFAWAMDMLSYQTDRVINETFIETATLRESVFGIAAMLGYSPVPASAASGEVTFTIAATTDGAVTIPAGTRVMAPLASGQPILFETVEELVVPGNTESPSVFSATTAVLQGETVSDEVVAVSDATINQRYPLFRQNVLKRSVLVDIALGEDVARWVEVTDIATAGPSEPVFQVLLDTEGLATIRFGDGFTGAVPPLGSEIRCTYRIGDGSAGNVEVGAVNHLQTSVTNVTSVTNLSKMTGGQDAESLESIRRSAPRSLDALSRAITSDDYAALALRVSGVVKASASAQVWSLVQLYIVPNMTPDSAPGGVISADLEARVQTALEPRKLANATIVVGPAVYVGINLAVELAVLPTYYRDNVQRQVANSIASSLSFLRREFGESVTLSLIYRAIHAVPGVDYAVVTLMVREDAAAQSGVSDGAIAMELDEIPVLARNYSQHVELTGTGLGGTFTLADGPDGAGPTGDIPYNAGGSVLKNALVAGGLVTDSGDVRVTGEQGGPWVVTWQGNKAGVAVDDLTIDTTDLTGTGPGGSVASQDFGLDLSVTGGIV